MFHGFGHIIPLKKQRKNNFPDIFLTAVGGIANSVDPDLTVPSGAGWSDCALFTWAFLWKTLVLEMQEQKWYFSRPIQQVYMYFVLIAVDSKY